MTPAKPIRLLCSGVDDGVSPLTEMGSTPGSDGQLPRTFRNIGAQLQEAQGGARLLAGPRKAASGSPGTALSGDEPGDGGDGAEIRRSLVLRLLLSSFVLNIASGNLTKRFGVRSLMRLVLTSSRG